MEKIKNKKTKPSKQKIPTNALFDSFKKYCEAIRKTNPVFTRFKDGNLIKQALKYLSKFQIEMLFLWFLKEKGHMRPTIGSALSKGIITDFISASHREYGFYNKLGQLAEQYASIEKDGEKLKAETSEMVKALQKLRSEFFKKFKPFSYQAQAKISEEVSRMERVKK